MRKTITLLLMFLLILPCFAACGEQPGKPVMNIDFPNGVMTRNGTEQRTYQTDDGSADIGVSIRKESGRLDIVIHEVGNEENRLYRGNDISTADFIVHTGTAGEYVVKITATDFVGDYTFTFYQSGRKVTTD